MLIIFPIWLIILIYKIKNSQNKILDNVFTLAAKINKTPEDEPTKTEAEKKQSDTKISVQMQVEEEQNLFSLISPEPKLQIFLI